MSTPLKLLLILLILVGIGTACLWILGGKKNEYSAELVIHAHPSQVFPYLTDPDKLLQWVNGLEEVEKREPIPEDASSHRIPVTRQKLTTSDGKSVAFEDQVIRYRPDQLLTVRSTNADQIRTSISKLELTPEGETFFSYRIKVTHRGLGRLLSPIFRHDVDQEVRKSVEALKALVEKNEPPFKDDSDASSLYQSPRFPPAENDAEKNDAEKNASEKNDSELTPVPPTLSGSSDDH